MLPISRNYRERQGRSVVNNPVTGRRLIVLPVDASVRARCCRALCRAQPIFTLPKARRSHSERPSGVISDGLARDINFLAGIIKRGTLNPVSVTPHSKFVGRPGGFTRLAILINQEQQKCDNPRRARCA